MSKTCSPKRSCSDASASRECTVRMSARFSSTPSSCRSGLRLSRASSTTSIACSTPCSAKYWASAVTSARSAATSALTVNSPSEGGQSIRITSYSSGAFASARLQRQLPAHLAAQHQLGLGEAQVGGDQVVVDRLGRARAPRQHVGDRRLGVGRDVEVVGQVPLRVEVHRQRPDARAAQRVGERAHGGGLAGAPLLGEHGDRRCLSSPCAGDTTRQALPGPCRVASTRRPR